jgi:hypothetical protein
VTRTQILLQGAVASNGPVTDVAPTAAAVDSASQVTCGDATLAANGIGF